MFMNWKIQHSQDVSSLQIDIKIPASIFVDIDKIILIFIWTGDKTKKVKTTLKE